MKFYIALLLFVSTAAFAQVGDFFSSDTVVIVRPANATPYAAGDAVRDTGQAVFVAVTSPGAVGSKCWINYISLCADTSNTSGANFTLLMYTDTVGVGKHIAADNALFQQQYAFGAKRLPSVSFALKAYGTAAGGASGSWDSQYSVNIPYQINSNRRLYFLLICDGAYTPKQSGKFRILVQSSYYR